MCNSWLEAIRTVGRFFMRSVSFAPENTYADSKFFPTGGVIVYQGLLQHSDAGPNTFVNRCAELWTQFEITWTSRWGMYKLRTNTCWLKARLMPKVCWCGEWCASVVTGLRMVGMSHWSLSLIKVCHRVKLGNPISDAVMEWKPTHNYTIVGPFEIITPDLIFQAADHLGSVPGPTWTISKRRVSCFDRTIWVDIDTSGDWFRGFPRNVNDEEQWGPG
jgi:hypothetical protein